MTDEEYFTIVATFTPSFLPSGDTCAYFNGTSCIKCKAYNPDTNICGIMIQTFAPLPSFLEKVVKFHPEKLL
jgi:hypothetical protein